MNNLHNLTGDFYFVVLPKDAEHIKLELLSSSIGLKYYVSFFTELGKWDGIWVRVFGECELIGLLGEITEEQAREIIGEDLRNQYLESLPSIRLLIALIESKVNISESKILILKAKK